jgi:hypothetical protein
MYILTGKLKVALPLLLAMSIALSGFADLALARRCIDASNTSALASCSTTRCCCSHETDKPRGCFCSAKKAPTPEPKNSGVNTSAVDLKLASWIHTPFLAPTTTEGGDVLSTPEGRFFFPGGPSIQLRLCIWRI